MSNRTQLKIVPAVPQTTREEVVGQYCDRCDRDLPRPSSCYDVRDFELKFEEGTQYPEGGEREGWEVPDLCDDCLEVLRLLLEANGFKITTIERSTW